MAGDAGVGAKAGGAGGIAAAGAANIGGANAGAAGGDGAIGEVTVCPQVGQGPLTPAIDTGTVSVVPQALHWNWRTSAGFMTNMVRDNNYDAISQLRQSELLGRAWNLGAAAPPKPVVSWLPDWSRAGFFRSRPSCASKRLAPESPPSTHTQQHHPHLLYEPENSFWHGRRRSRPFHRRRSSHGCRY